MYITQGLKSIIEHMDMEDNMNNMNKNHTIWTTINAQMKILDWNIQLLWQHWKDNVWVHFCFKKYNSITGFGIETNVMVLQNWYEKNV